MPIVRKDGTATIRIIQPGWGSSGYYSPEVLARDGPKIFKKDTQMFWNHQTPTEEAERPEGDLNNLAGKLITDARWMPDHPKGPGLYADTQIYGTYQESVNDLGPDIGISIRALGKAQQGQAEGRQGPIIQEISAVKSTDFVTKPGAGGAILQLFESARRSAAPTPRNGDPITPQGDENMGDLEALREANAQLEKKLADQAALTARLQEGLLLREAEALAATELAKSELPVVTQKRLLPILSKTAPIKDGKLDKVVFQAQIAETIKDETAYLVEVTGGGKITGMGSTTEVDPKPEELVKSMKESYLTMGYDNATAEKLAKGR
jgi:hypothetical protein